MTRHDEAAYPPNWMFEMGYWVADGDPEPDVPWPSDWEVCGIPSFDPFLTSNKPKRRGTTCLAWPMYHVADPFLSLAAACFVPGADDARSA